MHHYLYFEPYRRRPIPIKNTENVQGEGCKEEAHAAVKSYARISDKKCKISDNLTVDNTYENIHDENLYDAPYEGSREGSSYEPVPVLGGNTITINGVSVRS